MKRRSVAISEMKCRRHRQSKGEAAYLRRKSNRRRISAPQYQRIWRRISKLGSSGDTEGGRNQAAMKATSFGIEVIGNRQSDSVTHTENGVYQWHRVKWRNGRK